MQQAVIVRIGYEDYTIPSALLSALFDIANYMTRVHQPGGYRAPYEPHPEPKGIIESIRLESYEPQPMPQATIKPTPGIEMPARAPAPRNFDDDQEPS